MRGLWAVRGDGVWMKVFVRGPDCLTAVLFLLASGAGEQFEGVGSVFTACSAACCFV